MSSVVGLPAGLDPVGWSVIGMLAHGLDGDSALMPAADTVLLTHSSGATETIRHADGHVEVTGSARAFPTRWDTFALAASVAVRRLHIATRTLRWRGHWLRASAPSRTYPQYRCREQLPGLGAGERQLAHRVSFTVFYGPIPAGFSVDHACQVRYCQRPDHLRLLPDWINNAMGGHGVPTRTALARHARDALAHAGAGLTGQSDRR